MLPLQPLTDHLISNIDRHDDIILDRKIKSENQIEFLICAMNANIGSSKHRARYFHIEIIRSTRFML